MYSLQVLSYASNRCQRSLTIVTDNLQKHKLTEKQHNNDEDWIAWAKG